VEKGRVRMLARLMRELFKDLRCRKMKKKTQIWSSLAADHGDWAKVMVENQLQENRNSFLFFGENSSYKRTNVLKSRIPNHEMHPRWHFLLWE